MTNIDFKVDYVNSVFLSHHIICCPLELTEMYNKKLIASLPLEEQHKKAYRDYWLNLGHKIDLELRYKLFYPELNDFQEAVTFLKEKSGASENLVRGFISFEERFREYFKPLEEKAQEYIAERQPIANGLMQSIIDYTREITGESPNLPESYNVRILEGIAPSSFKFNNLIGEQMRNWLTPGRKMFTSLLIHEGIGHDISEPYLPIMKRIMGDYFYEIDESFVKAYTNHLLGIIEEDCKDWYSVHGPGMVAFNIFSSNMPKLNKNFKEWYTSCLREIKSQSPLEYYPTTPITNPPSPNK